MPYSRNDHGMRKKHFKMIWEVRTSSSWSSLLSSLDAGEPRWLCGFSRRRRNIVALLLFTGCLLYGLVISKVNRSAHLSGIVMTRLLKATFRSFCLCNTHEALDHEFREQTHKKVLII